MDSTPSIGCKPGMPLSRGSMQLAAIPDSYAGEDEYLMLLSRQFGGSMVSVFANNTAGRRGGAIACVACNALVLRETTFLGNNAGSGAVIFAELHNVTQNLMFGSLVLLEEINVVGNAINGSGFKEAMVPEGAPLASL